TEPFGQFGLENAGDRIARGPCGKGQDQVDRPGQEVRLQGVGRRLESGTDAGEPGRACEGKPRKRFQWFSSHVKSPIYSNQVLQRSASGGRRKLMTRSLNSWLFS